jgi:hypothetical protein
MDSRPHLSRYAIEPGVKVFGGLSKLSKAAFQKIGEFITFVHYRLSNGSAYKKAGYLFEKFIRPDYFYFSTKASKIISKQSRKKNAVPTPEDMTESEFARTQGLYRVYDCGKMKFVFKV